MSQNKTRPTESSVEAFLNTVEDETKLKDSFVILELMKKITGEKPVLWGNSLIGFGEVHYKYASGREGDWFHVGFSPRKQNLTIYIMPGFKRYDELMQKLGKYKTGKSCLYIKKLADVDMDILTELITQSAEHTKSLYN
ncbi:DUF1801 domain-containing protein [Leptobacterium flavescens]|uniref:DUF1801 domain-containing protein n=1 Tax=Leptobacterium flavescens TaxID=472055 RepID=A0A6P0UF93_9FLAO|nr:DUF1801 domain-containing protein [Leptobacterium flavescens]NER11915.1 DUF1801 domain-containing protein [Leptobacterium flavescens]